MTSRKIQSANVDRELAQVRMKNPTAQYGDELKLPLWAQHRINQLAHEVSTACTIREMAHLLRKEMKEGK